MDDFLANVYNTAQTIGAYAPADETEKLAQAAVLDQVLANDGLSVDDLSADQLLKVAAGIFGPENEIQKVAQAAPAPMADKEKEAADATAHADFLGRQMAHAFVHQLGEFDKVAAANGSPTSFLQAALSKQAMGMYESGEDEMPMKEKKKKDEEEDEEEEKKASAIDILAHQLAVEKIKEAGYTIDADGNVYAPQDDTEQKLASVVESRAAQMLQQWGFLK